MANIRTLSDMHGGSGSASSSHNEKRVKFIHSENQISQEFSNAGGKLIVIDFSASWCGPCKAVSPVYADLSEKYPDVVFLKVDVDEMSNFSQKSGVRAMPTFQFIKNSQKIAELQGANVPKLEQLIQEHATPSSSSPSPFSGQQLGSGGVSSDVQDKIQSELLGMDFDMSLIKAARESTPFNSLQDVVEWIFQYQSAAEKLGGTPIPPHDPQPAVETSRDTAPEPSQARPTLTPEEIERQNQLLEEKLQQLRMKKAKEEEEREHNREIMRRKSGKETQDALKKWEDERANKEIEAVKREKELERIHKEDVRRKVEINRLNRAKLAGSNATTPSVPPPSTPSVSTSTTTQPNSDTGLIQLRLPNGQVTQASFLATDSLQTVADFVGALLQVQPSQLTLSTAYPRKSFTHTEFNTGLAHIGVFPRGQIIVKQ